MATDPNVVAKQFTDFYYQTFSSGRQNLGTLYVREPPNSNLLRSSLILSLLSANTPC
jgi:hypothetical protein